MSKGKQPKYDAGAAVAAQTKANTDAYKTSAQAAGKSGPFGSSAYKFDANGLPVGTETQFSDPLDRASNNTQGNVANASGFLPQTPFKLSEVPSGVDVSNAIYSQGMNYLKPQFEQQNKNLELQLYNRGIPIGQNDVYKDSTANLADSQSRAVTDLATRATLAAPAEQQRQIQNRLLERNQGYADMGQGIGLLASMSGLLPQASGIGNMQTVDAMGAYDKQYQSEAQAAAAKAKMYGDLAKMGVSLAMAPMTGGGSLFGSAMSGMGGMFAPSSAAQNMVGNDLGGTYYV